MCFVLCCNVTYQAQSKRQSGVYGDQLQKRSSGHDNHPYNTATRPHMYLCTKIEPKFNTMDYNYKLQKSRYYGVPSTCDYAVF